MARKKTAAQLQREIDEALQNEAWKRDRTREVWGDRGYLPDVLPKKSPKPVKPKSITATDIMVLTSAVIKHGQAFSMSDLSGMAPRHVKRAIASGLVEPVGNETDKALAERGFYTNVRLTPTGREIVADALIADIAKEHVPMKHYDSLSPEKRAEVLARDRASHEAQIATLERVLAKIR